MVNKIPDSLDNPIDNILYKIIDGQLDLFKKLNLTPNLLTTVSLVSGLGSVYLLKNNNYKLSALLWFISYYFDCTDGKMARKFNMTSKFGDLYDHGSDTIKHILLFYVIYSILKDDKNFKHILIIFLLIFILSMAQLGCQEKLTKKITKKDDSPTLQITETLVITDCETQMKFTRYFGPATITLYLVLVILYVNFR